MQVRKFGKRVHPDALGAIAELFLVAGDMTAWLYTGSQVRAEMTRVRRAGEGSGRPSTDTAIGSVSYNLVLMRHSTLGTVVIPALL